MSVNSNPATTGDAGTLDPQYAPLKVKTRIQYGCGDVACNVVYGITGTLLTLFYTDYAGVPAASIALIFLIARFFDGVSDFIMGFIVERTHSKWGMARPWVLWMAIPYCVCAVLMFCVPNGSAVVKFAYVFVTYNLVSTVCYTALNLPYGTLATMMTRSSRERDLLASFRMGLAPIGKIIVVSATLPIVKVFGNDQAAWIKTMTIWAIMAFILLIICFRGCEEKVVIEAREGKKPEPIIKSLKMVLTNAYFWVGLILWAMMCVYSSVIGTSLPYYCKYIIGNDGWMYSLLYFVEVAVTVVCTLFCPALSKKFGKRNAILMGIIVAIIGQFILIIAPYSFGIVVVTSIIRGIGVAPLCALVFGVVGDAVDYGQWKKHHRQESLICSCASVGNKIGMGLTAFIISMLMSVSGYLSSTGTLLDQPQSALNMIENIYKFGTLIPFAVIVVVMLLYKLDKLYPTIIKDLQEREARGEM